ncbi:UPF0042 nucleotide-binding protein [Ferrithrix thermotolerans DSM 19514]|uniref:UPF0042 nucleotide-binding protein n=1 Tax=Ferrithrix thermotolerans DSM 19514 TaxID=1121881 RepID=A0A1M4SCB0_9ACTN|nr:RNase adapter RapZ [Ferrithrix thermotolerans]SHE29841.1 UPF0042 nucleotide-binding protein [Ferrithrix thermotolerans DSM 19514]
MSLVIVSGMSGAGRSSVAAALEDLGWFVIDNMPPSLMPKVVELAESMRDPSPSLGLVVGREVASDISSLIEAVELLRDQIPATRVVFLDASDDALIQRYEGTKRRHPVPGESVIDSIHREREILSKVKDLADIVIDSSDLSVHELRSRVYEVFSADGTSTEMRVVISSFGYKHGLPRDADLVFDCRFLPNPYWDKSLREQTGLDQGVRDYLLSKPEVTEFLGVLQSFVGYLLPKFRAEGKSYLSVAIGCTGGKHRSVFLAEELRKWIEANGGRVSVRHRDFEK